jgi:hypothetical protein
MEYIQMEFPFVDELEHATQLQFSFDYENTDI